MVRVFIMGKLKEGTDYKDYLDFSINLDQKVTPNQPGIRKFEVYKIIETEGDKNIHHVVEVIDVESVEILKKVLASKEMEKVEKRYYELVERDTEKILYSEIVK